MLLKRYRSLFFFLLVLFFQDLTGQAQSTKATVPFGGVQQDSLQYSVYLPADFSLNNKYPLLIFLDPGARGDFPVSLYRKIADAHEIILAGSLNSRNFDQQTSIGSIEAILRDIDSKYRVDKDRVWLSGFSGGARLGSSYALRDTAIKAVIACGAGFAGNEFITGNNKILFAGIVGLGDMNFEELTGISEQLSVVNKENLLLYFNGGHQWPPEREMNQAISWLLKDKGKVAEDPGDLADSLYQEGMYYLPWLLLTNLEKISGENEKIAALKAQIGYQKKFKRDKNEFQQVLATERQLMDEFSFLFSQTVYNETEDEVNKAVWKEKINKIRTMVNNKRKYVLLSGRRLFDFGWRICLEQYHFLMGIRQFLPAYKAASILSLFDLKQVNTRQLLLQAKERWKEKN